MFLFLSKRKRKMTSFLLSLFMVGSIAFSSFATARTPTVKGSTLPGAALELAYAYMAHLQNRDLVGMAALLSDDFIAETGGWPGTSCEPMNKEGHVAHIASWQSTWSSNVTFFNFRYSIPTFSTAAILASVEYFGPNKAPISVKEVAYFVAINTTTFRIVRLVELSTVVQPPNFNEMIGVWNSFVANVQCQNVEGIASLLASNITWVSMDSISDKPAHANKTQLVAAFAQQFKETSSIVVSTWDVSAACRYVWAVHTELWFGTSAQEIFVAMALFHLDGGNNIDDALVLEAVQLSS